VPEKRRECRQAALYSDAQKPALAKAGGAPWLKTTLVQCAWAAARKKASYLQAQFHRLRARRGAKKAIGALAALAQGKQVHRLIDRLRNLGFAVQITPVEAAA
jgi:transposase